MTRSSQSLTRRLRSIAVAGLVLYPMTACTSQDAPSELATRRTVQLRLEPQFSSAHPASAHAPLIAARLTVVGVSVFGDITRDTVAGAFRFDVSPTDDQWTLPLDFESPEDYRSIAVILELIANVNGVDVVEWSGLSAPITLGSVGDPRPSIINVFHGSTENLRVTSVRITNAPQSMLEGDSIRILAEAVGSTSPDIQWRTSDTIIATISASGMMRPRRNGAFYIIAEAGHAIDSTAVNATARPASIRILPDTIKDVSVGEEVRLTATVLDGRGVAIEAAPVTWTSSAQNVMLPLASGRFSARAVGSASLRATSASQQTVAAAAIAIVTTRVAANLRLTWVGTLPSDNVVIGTPFTLQVIGANTGTVATPAASARLRITDAVTGAVAFDSIFPQPPIEAGSPFGLSFPVRLSSTRTWPASVRVSITADVNNTIAETDEADNSAQSGVITIRPAGSLMTEKGPIANATGPLPLKTRTY